MYDGWFWCIEKMCELYLHVEKLPFIIRIGLTSVWWVAFYAIFIAFTLWIPLTMPAIATHMEIKEGVKNGSLTESG